MSGGNKLGQSQAGLRAHSCPWQVGLGAVGCGLGGLAGLGVGLRFFTWQLEDLGHMA